MSAVGQEESQGFSRVSSLGRARWDKVVGREEWVCPKSGLILPSRAGSKLVPLENEREAPAHAAPGQLSQHLPAPAVLFSYLTLNKLIFTVTLC